ncbi:MAG TPA: hypothetical protein VE645_07630 [Pseudonocardiaceae bacterium]|nr:hypothetical protein [Pseudonocardiaceae bacterium]
MLLVHAVGPVGKHLPEIGVSGNAQSEINVRPLIFTTDCGRPGHRGARDAGIGVGR